MVADICKAGMSVVETRFDEGQPLTKTTLIFWFRCSISRNSSNRKSESTLRSWTCSERRPSAKNDSESVPSTTDLVNENMGHVFEIGISTS